MADRGSRVVTAIGIFKLVKGTLLVVVAGGALSLVPKDAARIAARGAGFLHLGVHNRYVAGAIARLGLISAGHMHAIGVITLLYAVVFFVEGGGLLAKKPWAEYMTIFVTGSFIPLEVYETLEHPNLGKLLTILVNVVVVAYLVVRRIRLARSHEKTA